MVDNTIDVTGVTKFSDGSPTEAFVWAWSNQGGHEEFRSLKDGVFKLSLASNQSWHVAANKDLSGKSYKTTELTISTMERPSPITLVFIKEKTPED